MTNIAPTEQERQDALAAVRAIGPGHHAAWQIRATHHDLVHDPVREMAPIRLGQVLAQLGYTRKMKWDPAARRKDRPGHHGQMVKGWIL